MGIEFSDRGSRWRSRGRPPLEVPEELLAALRQSYADGTQANIDRAGAGEREVRQVLALLQRGAQQLGLRLRAQHDDTEIRFWAEAAASE